MRGVGGNGEALEGGGELVGVELYEAHKGVYFGSVRTAPDGIVAGGLHDGGFEGGHGLFAKSCCHGLSNGGGF